MFHIPKITSLLLFWLLFLDASGQDSISRVQEVKPLRENIHLHLNKTVFAKGEHLWFQAYVQDKNSGMPSFTTTNLHVGIFDKNQGLVTKKMFMVKNGVGSGDFKIDSTFTDDSYTLMAWTNYMKNFKNAAPFFQPLTILGSTKEPSVKMMDTLSILIRPEGQHIVANANNTIGIMLCDAEHRPIETSGIQLVCGDGQQIKSNIRTNELGQGRFRFFADSTKSYFLKVRGMDGQWISKKLEETKQNGLGISIDNKAGNVVAIRPIISDSSLPHTKVTRFKLAIVNQRNVSVMQDYVINKDNLPMVVDRNKIPIGVNTAILMDENMRPVSQRVFFNKRPSSQEEHQVELNYCLSKNKDSLQLDFALPKGQKNATVSVSVLPAGSMANWPNNSITSSFLIKPYLNEELPYFFEGNRRSRDYQLDTRLLMENGAKPKEIGVSNLEKKPYTKEEYIAFHGKIIDADLTHEKQVSIMSQPTGMVQLFDLSRNKDFEGNLPVFQGDSLMVSVLNTKGELRKPKMEFYLDSDKNEDLECEKWLREMPPMVLEPSHLETDNTLEIGDSTIMLDETVVFGSVHKVRKFQLTALTEGRIIDQTTVKRYRSFQTYIHILGFQTRQNAEEGGIGVFIYDPPGLKAVPVYIEGMAASSNELLNLPLSSISSMVYSKSTQGPFIALRLRYDYDQLNGKEKFGVFVATKGFTRPQPYFNPNYPDHTSELYTEYAAVWWESQLEVSSEITHSITVPLNGQKEVKVIVEGMSSDGSLYHTEQLCSPFKNQLF